ncbi:hypothetical protein MIR68_006136 [Amoeboaphelidium protococcarum]|nr:hypothetical protein MIR68_006136 [Amoeboaphelidium protococcarum]KAI3648831.1 hypothetical protein MP228_006685 [Amoeboaphelidium protococcarum]KAI3649410.1 hypothetical protein MP228_005042 [Amoeboaphelidium protococcarum]
MSRSSQLPPTHIACVMVGLPARGKTSIGRKLSRYLYWLGVSTKVFNVGQYRRKVAGAQQPHHFFDTHNEEANILRQKAADQALYDMISWFKKIPSDDLEEDSTHCQASNISDDIAAFISQINGNVSFDPAKKDQDGVTYVHYPTLESSASHNEGSHPKDVKVAIYDATNSTIERRKWLAEQCQRENIQVMFIESICTDNELIMSNIKEVKLTSPDYLNSDPEKAAEDFIERIKHYEEVYETVNKDDKESHQAYLKLINVGTQVIINRIHGYLQSRIVYYLMNLHIHPRSIFLCRHGESMYNVIGRIGGDSDLSPRGREFAKSLPQLIEENVPADVRSKLTVWTSTAKRTIQTAEYLPYPKLQWKALEEIDAGVCDGLTYEEIEERYPEDFAERDNDKYHYRYRGGESYRDLVLRLEPIIIELERRENIFIIGHQAVLRAIYAYFVGLPQHMLPYVKVPLHTVVKLCPKAYGTEETICKANVEAVDTYRSRPGSHDEVLIGTYDGKNNPQFYSQELKP